MIEKSRQDTLLHVAGTVHLISGHVLLTIHGVSGSRMALALLGVQYPGLYTDEWNGRRQATLVLSIHYKAFHAARLLLGACVGFLVRTTLRFLLQHCSRILTGKPEDTHKVIFLHDARGVSAPQLSRRTCDTPGARAWLNQSGAWSLGR